jgi:hypothetical protein
MYSIQPAPSSTDDAKEEVEKAKKTRAPPEDIEADRVRQALFGKEKV